MGRRVVFSDKYELGLLVGILLLATVLRVAWPTLTEFKFSEARLEALALELTREGRLPLLGVPSSAGFDHSPISVYLYVPAFLFTTDPIPATIYGGLVGVAAVFLCWWLSRRWPGGGRRAALTAAALFAVSPWSVAFSRKIWQVTFVPLFTLAFVGLIISALVEGSDANQPKAKTWNLAWAMVVYALLVQIHPSAVSVALALILWLILFWRRVRLTPLLVGGALGAVTAIPFLVYQAQNEWPAFQALTSLPGSVWDLCAIRLGWEAITGRGIHALAGDAYPILRIVPQLGWFFNLVGWLAAGGSLWLAWRAAVNWRKADADKRQAARVNLILLTWLLIPLLFNLRHSMELHLHFFAIIAPAAYLIIGRAVVDIFNTVSAANTRARALRIAGALGLSLLMVGQVIALILIARFVAGHDTPGGFGTPLGRYLEAANKTLTLAEQIDAAEILIVGAGNSIVVDEIPAIFDVLLRDKTSYRFVDGRTEALFPHHRSIAMLTPEAGEATIWYGRWPTHTLPDGYRLVELDGSWPQKGLDAVTGPRTFQSGVEMQGYAWQAEGPAAGKFWLLWQVLWLNQEDTHFFVHLLDQNEQLWGQQDSSGYPAANRRKGDRIVSQFDITQDGPASGAPYWAQSGMYTYPQVVGIPVIDDTGNPTSDKVIMELGWRGE